MYDWRIKYGLTHAACTHFISRYNTDTQSMEMTVYTHQPKGSCDTPRDNLPPQEKG